MITKSELKKIKRLLPENHVELIFKKIKGKCSERNIRYVLNGGRSDNHGIIEAAIEIANERKTHAEELRKQIKQL